MVPGRSCSADVCTPAPFVLSIESVPCADWPRKSVQALLPADLGPTRGLSPQYAVPNVLYCGDNLRVLREEIRPESVDLVYLDPPFNSQEDYGVIYREADGSKAAAQVSVFEDTWTWNEMSALAHYQTVTAGGPVGQALQAFRALLDEGNMLAYLSMMAPRLAELRNVFKPTGSLYLHCDDTASHYLKLLLDAVFGPRGFRAQIIWKRTTSHNDARRTFGDVVDTIFYYVKSDAAPFWPQYGAYSAHYLASKYRYVDDDGRRYRLSDLRSPHPRPNLTYDYKGFKPHPNGWAVSREKMKALDEAGRLEFPRKPEGRIQLRRYLDERKGMPIHNVWDDIRPINAMAAERLGYPTQKPKALLERIIAASSKEGDVVLDPFCGCGTTIDAAQGLKRQWIGIDVTHLAISVIRSRLKNEYPDQDLDIRIAWLPTKEVEARKLAGEDPFQFQCWVLGELGINPLYQKKGADRGVDGRLFFFEAGSESKTPVQIVFSVKGGKLSPAFVRDLAGVVQRERAAIGVLVTLERPTREMVKEAASVAPFRSRDGSLYPGLQILTVKDILEGARVEHPPGRSLSFPDARMARAAAAAASARQTSLKFG